MASQPLSYASPNVRRAKRKWPWRGVLLLTVGLLLLLSAVPAFPAKHVVSRVDAVTGTMSWQTTWTFGLTSPPRVNVSPLEARLKRGGIPWTPRWSCLHDNDYDLFGHRLSCGCGTAPPVYTLQPCSAEFAKASTDAELREFVRVMQSGTDAEQEAAVQAACDKALKEMDADLAQSSR